MAELINSILGPLSPIRSPKSPEDHHELPFYNSPPSSSQSPSSAYPLQPITSSVYLTRAAKSPVRVPDDLLAVQRKGRYLEQQLQELLDAQADGLMATLNPPAVDDRFSEGSATPTVSSVRNESIASTTARAPRKIGLNSARRGIYKRIQQLAAVKAEELDFLDSEMSTVKTIWDQTDRWNRKRHGLQNKIRAIEQEGADSKENDMREKANQLEQEIRRKEEELWAMKAKHRRLLNELADAENSMEAKLSSYKTSLSLLEKEITLFLTRPPDADHLPLEASPFITLPPKRRTLDMAMEYWQEEHTRLEDKCQEVDVDRSALEDGSALWKNVMDRIMEFENNLQKLIQKREGSDDGHDLLAHMEKTVHYLEQQVKLASSKKWNLLVCSIGAELEAFKQGRDMLEVSLGLGKKANSRETEMQTLGHGVNSETDPFHDSPSPSPSLSQNTSDNPLRPKFYDTDDEDPDPELLISQRDTSDTD